MKRRVAIILLLIMLLPMRAHAAEIPEDIREAAEGIGEAYAVSPALILAICYEESRFTPNIKNRSGRNLGLMQVNPAFNKARMERLGVTREELLTVMGNILVGTDLLAELFEDYEDVGDVLLQYGGFSKAKKDRYHKDGTLPAYITRLLDRAAYYEQLLGKEGESHDDATGAEDAGRAADNGGAGQDSAG